MTEKDTLQHDGVDNEQEDLSLLNDWMAGRDSAPEGDNASVGDGNSPEATDAPDGTVSASDEPSSDLTATVGEDDGLSEAYKSVYGEDLEPDATPEAQEVDTYTSQVNFQRDALIREHRELTELLGTLTGLDAFPPEVQSYNGKPLDQLSKAEAGQFMMMLYDAHGDAMVNKGQEALHMVERNNEVLLRVNQYKQQLDAHQWDEAVAEVVAKAPLLATKLDKVRSKVEELLLKVKYPEGDLVGKQKLIKSAVRSLITVTPKEPLRQTPEAGLGTSSSNVATNSVKPAMTEDEAVEMVMKGELNLFDLPSK